MVTVNALESAQNNVKSPFQGQAILPSCGRVVLTGLDAQGSAGGLRLSGLLAKGREAHHHAQREEDDERSVHQHDLQ